MVTSKDDYKSLSFELDEVLERLQSGDVDIDEAVRLYERGNELVKKLEAYLKTAENKVKKVRADFGQK